MSIIDSAFNLASKVANLVPIYGPVASAAIDLFHDVVDKIAPMVDTAVNNSTLSAEAKDTFNQAYDLGFG